MLFKCEKGMFHIQENYRDAFNLEMFISKYIEECFDKYPYLVGDISSGVLRLKGFDSSPKSTSYIGDVRNYLETSCSFGCPYYLLKRVKSESEYEHLLNVEKNKKPIDVKPLITPIQKENFDKESLILKSTPKTKAKIVIDTNKINQMPKGNLPKDLIEIINQEVKESKQKEETIVVQTASYVSASPDFDPSKIKRSFNNDSKNNKSNNKNVSNNNRFNKNNTSNNSNNPNNKHKKNNKKPQTTSKA